MTDSQDDVTTQEETNEDALALGKETLEDLDAPEDAEEARGGDMKLDAGSYIRCECSPTSIRI